MNPLMAEFISETKELLEQASQGLLALEKGPGDPETLNSLFRAMHTIKGSSGLLEVGPLTRLVHAAEDVLDAVRQGDLEPTPDRVDLFFEVLDRVGQWVDDLEASEELPPDAGETGGELVRFLRELLADEEAAAPAQPDAGPDREPAKTGSNDHGPGGLQPSPPPAWLSEIPDEVRRDLYRRSSSAGANALVVTYTPDEQCFFAGDDPFHTARHVPGLVWGAARNREPWPSQEDLDPYRCVLELRLVTTATQSEVQEWFRYVAEQVKVLPVPPTSWVFPVGEPGEHEPFGPFVEDARQWAEAKRWDDLRAGVAAALEVAGQELFQTSALRWLEVVLEAPDPETAVVDWLVACVSQGEAPAWKPAPDGAPAGANPASADQAATAPSGAGAACPETTDSGAAAEILQGQVDLLSRPCDPAIRQGVFGSAARVLESVLAGIGDTETAARVEQALEAACGQGSAEPLKNLAAAALARIGAAPAPGTSGRDRTAEGASAPSPSASACSNGGPPEHQKLRVLKVDQARIDALMDLLGELVVAKNALPFLARKAEDRFGVRELAREIKNQHAVINRIAEELQGAVMQVRMVPVSHAFQRFPRLVRDLSRKLQKKIRLVTEGEETEADKNVVEDLSEPLVHLVRNSLDHGIEPPKEREAHGKPPEGQIILRAAQIDDQVVIEVGDDGRGMDPEVLKRKAYEKGILSEERLETITDAEALHLIFAPGFSTADEVSEVSGRGVGMDAVRAMVDRVGGSVAVESALGRGTRIRLSLPLSMAVTRVMIVEVGGQTLGVPIENIVETVRIPAEGIHRIKKHEAAVLRDRLVPLCRLARALELEDGTPADESDEAAVLVVTIDGRELGLVVDRFHEGADIILKPMEGIMAGFRMYAGTALLGDGRVLLVLNLRELVRCL